MVPTCPTLVVTYLEISYYMYMMGGLWNFVESTWQNQASSFLLLYRTTSYYATPGTKSIYYVSYWMTLPIMQLPSRLISVQDYRCLIQSTLRLSTGFRLIVGITKSFPTHQYYLSTSLLLGYSPFPIDDVIYCIMSGSLISTPLPLKYLANRILQKSWRIPKWLPYF